MAKLSLLLCCLRDGENNLPSTPFKIYTEFNKKCARTNDTAARNICNERKAGSTLLRTIFELFFQEFCYETHRLSRKRWESAKKFFLRSQITSCLDVELTSCLDVELTGRVFFCSDN